MWYQLLDYIKQTLLDGGIKNVRVGGILPQHLGLKDEGANCVVLIRKSEQVDKNTWLVTFFLETWTRSDNPNLEIGYKLLTDLEQKVENVLHERRELVIALDDSAMVTDEWQLMDVYITQKEGDFDSIRPLLGTSYTITARLFNHGEER